MSFIMNMWDEICIMNTIHPDDFLWLVMEREEDNVIDQNFAKWMGWTD